MLMFNSHDDMTAFHDDEVKLPIEQRQTMRDRRNTNRKRLKDGLARDEMPAPVGCHTQGSYAMRTMVQHVEKDYDIDDGVYFTRSSLTKPSGSDRTPAEAKEMVRAALHSDRFTDPPECQKNCVRVFYNEGYHVDVPVYRRFEKDGEWVYERASTEWKLSDPLAVTKWFKTANKSKSPNTNNYGQFNRVVKLLKAFARSRESWRAKIASGFMISVLVDEKYLAMDGRDDQALRDVMRAIHGRLAASLVIDHPVLDETVTNGDSDSRAKFFQDKLQWALGELEVLDKWNCTEEEARKAWDSVFNSSFFGLRASSRKSDETATQASVLLAATAKSAEEQAFDKRGGGRFG